MTNIQTITYPKPHHKLNILLERDIYSKPIKIIWRSLLGDETKNIVSNVLFQSSQLSTYIQKTHNDFVNEYKNYKKYPKINDDEWK